MNWVTLALQLLTALPKLMAVAEKAFDDIPDSGKEKKEMVTTVVKTIVSAVSGIPSGEQARTWLLINKIIDPAIDIMCTFLFPKDEVVS